MSCVSRKMYCVSRMSIEQVKIEWFYLTLYSHPNGQFYYALIFKIFRSEHGTLEEVLTAVSLAVCYMVLVL